MLELKDVRFSVTDEKGQLKNIINGINLKIDEGKFVAITGPNGSGKSTLAKLIVGIIKPTSGQILYNGQDITEMSITDRAKLGISFAFQQPVRFNVIGVFLKLRVLNGSESDDIYTALLSDCAHIAGGLDTLDVFAVYHALEKAAAAAHRKHPLARNIAQRLFKKGQLALEQVVVFHKPGVILRRISVKFGFHIKNSFPI